ncbi:MAG: MFS transporter [Pygmaiobacter massiliensis]
MESFVSKNKWSLLLAGAVVQIFTGVPAAWGVFQKPVKQAFGVEDWFASMIFAFTVGSFGVGCILGGLLQDKKGPRVAGIVGAVMLSGGFALSGLVPESMPWLLFFTFSLLVGLGCAFLYPSVMSAAQKWYSDKKGVATGVIGGAVGLSGAVLTLLGRWFIKMWGIHGAFLGFGAVMAVCCGSACILLCNPPKVAQQPKKKQQGKDYTVKQMLKTKQYYLVFFVVALATPAVLLFSPIIVELGEQRGLSESAAHLSIIIGSFGSAAGRLAMPALSDKIGRRAVDLGLFAALCLLSVAFIFAQGWWVIAGYTVLTFCYSGEAAVIPALGTDLFGFKNAGVNYGFLALGMSLGSVVFSLIAGGFGAVLARNIIAIAATALGFVLLLFLKPTQGKKL